MTPEERDLFLTVWLAYGIIGGGAMLYCVIVFTISILSLNQRISPPPPPPLPPWLSTVGKAEETAKEPKVIQ